MAIIASEFGYDLAKITAVLNHAKLVETAVMCRGQLVHWKVCLRALKEWCFVRSKFRHLVILI